MRLFVVGTDTGVGKTFVTAGLVRALRTMGRDAVAMKPIASGFEPGPTGPHNVDLSTLAAAAEGALCRDDLNVYAFAPAIAPHRAAELAGIEVRLGPIQAAFARVSACHPDVFVEGVGGFCVPLSPTLMLADLVCALDLPLLLVVGIRLGCINHALLSAIAIRAAGLELHGWIANHIDPSMSEPQASVDAIAARIGAPLLGSLRHGAGSGEFAALAATMTDGGPRHRPGA